MRFVWLMEIDTKSTFCLRDRVIVCFALIPFFARCRDRLCHFVTAKRCTSGTSTAKPSSRSNAKRTAASLGFEFEGTAIFSGLDFSRRTLDHHSCARHWVDCDRRHTRRMGAR